MMCVGKLRVTKAGIVVDESFSYFRTADSKLIEESRHLEVGDNSQSVTDWATQMLVDVLRGKRKVIPEKDGRLYIDGSDSDCTWAIVETEASGDTILSFYEPAA